VPHILLGGLINLRKLLLSGADLVGSLLRSIGSNILAKSRGITYCGSLEIVHDVDKALLT
jgi:hypothetical protein